MKRTESFLSLLVCLLVAGCAIVGAPQGDVVDGSGSQATPQSQTQAMEPSQTHDGETRSPFVATHTYAATSDAAPAFIDVTSDTPLAELGKKEIESMRVCYPLVGEYEFSDEEIAAFVDAISSLTLVRSMQDELPRDQGVHDVEIVFSDGESWLFEAVWGRTSSGSFVMAVDGGSYIVVEGEGADTFMTDYRLIEEKLNASLPDSLKPFDGLTQDDVVSVQCQYARVFEELSPEKTAQLIDILIGLEIDPHSASHELLSLMGGLADINKASNEQFRIEFVDGSSVVVGGGGGGTYISGVLYNGGESTTTLNDFYRSLF